MRRQQGTAGDLLRRLPGDLTIGSQKSGGGGPKRAALNIYPADWRVDHAHYIQPTWLGARAGLQFKGKARRGCRVLLAARGESAADCPPLASARWLVRFEPSCFDSPTLTFDQTFSQRGWRLRQASLPAQSCTPESSSSLTGTTHPCSPLTSPRPP
jgi:hypothetical protein